MHTPFQNCNVLYCGYFCILCNNSFFEKGPRVRNITRVSNGLNLAKILTFVLLGLN